MRISQTALQGIHPIRLSDYKTSDAKYSAWGKKSLEIRFRGRIARRLKQRAEGTA
jgi:hypothetical protein